MASEPAGIWGTLRSVRSILRASGVSRGQMALGLGLMLLTGVLEAAGIGMLIPLLNALISPGEMPNLGLLTELWQPLASRGRTALVVGLAAAVLALVAVKNVVSYASTAYVARVRRDSIIGLRELVLDRVLFVAPETLERRTTGDIANVFIGETSRSARALDLTLLLVQRALIALSYVAAILLISWHLTVLTALLGALLGVIGLVLGRRLLRRGHAIAHANVKLARVFGEVLGGARLVRVTATEGLQAKQFAPINHEQAEAEAEAARASVLLTASLETLAVCGAMLLTATAYNWFLIPDRLTTAEFMAFAFGLVRALPTVNHVYSLQAGVLSLAGSISNTLAWLQTPLYPPRPFGSESALAISGAIQLDNVSFAYATGAPALTGVSLTIEAGTTVALVGPSGSGKSTLANLLLRLRCPTAGRILFDGRDYWDFTPGSFARVVAFVEQEPFMFQASIGDNVAYGAPDATPEKIWHVLRMARMDEFVASLPAGLETPVGERGATLSGGQRQRLAIARALIRDPRILILDEPTSALDPRTEKEVLAAIDEARAGRTTIMIAHRESTMRHANRVVRLKDGALCDVEKDAVDERTSVGALASAAQDQSSSR